MTDYNTQPTIQTVLEEMRAGFAAMAEQFKIINTRLERIETKIDILGKRLLEVETTLVLHDRRINSLEDRT